MFSIKMRGEIVDKHYNGLKERLNQKLDGVIGAYEKRRAEAQEDGGMEDVYKEELEFFQALKQKDGELEIIKIIKARPEEQLKIYSTIRKKFNYQQDEKDVFEEKGFVKLAKEDTSTRAFIFKKSIKSVFDYDMFKDKSIDGSWDAYSLCELLDVRVCPYCNRQFTFTVMNENGKIIRPELDHYLPQSLYPMFALSIYNLIPACHVCNSNIKRTNELDIEKHFHPYVDENKEFKFYYEIEALKYGLRAKIRMNELGNKKAKDTYDFFKLPEIYEAHADVANRMLNSIIDNPFTYVDEVIDILSKNGYMFKVEEFIDSKLEVPQEEDKEVLGKLKKDIAMQIKTEYMEK